MVGVLIVSIGLIGRSRLWCYAQRTSACCELCTKTVGRSVDKVGVGACGPSRVAVSDSCMFFDQLIICRINNSLAGLFRGHWWGPDEVVHHYCGRVVHNAGMPAFRP